MKTRNEQKARSPSESAVETRHLIMPQHTNAYGTAFGGTIMSWIDITASMAARRHCGREVVTVQIDSTSFIAPAFIGDQIILKACVNYVGTTSMEVGVKVQKENPATGECITTCTAHLTFVSLDENKRPFPVPPLEPQDEDEKRRYENARLRVEKRKELRRQLKKNPNGE